MIITVIIFVTCYYPKLLILLQNKNNIFIFLSFSRTGHGAGRGKWERDDSSRKHAKREGSWAKNVSKELKNKGMAYVSSGKSHKKFTAKEVSINFLLIIMINILSI